jgi:probable rRNA maturation factor
LSAAATKVRRIARRGSSVLRAKAVQRDPVQVGVQLATGRRGVPQSGSFKRWANAAISAASLPELQKRQWALSVRVVGSAESRKLNRLWRGKDKPTNVLSFPSEILTAGSQLPVDDAQEAWSLGDLAICAPVVAREAKEQGKVLQAHWAHMVVHGTLHLLGYDHENDRDAERMESCEISILAQFGYPNPYV